MIDGREVGAGVGRRQNGSGGKFLCGELRTFPTILWPGFARRPFVWGLWCVALAVSGALSGLLVVPIT